MATTAWEKQFHCPFLRQESAKILTWAASPHPKTQPVFRGNCSSLFNAGRDFTPFHHSFLSSAPGTFGGPEPHFCRGIVRAYFLV
jgi:hypothetical protein